VFEFTALSGLWNTVVPAVSILLVVGGFLGAVAVYMSHLASRAAV
jgi:hypothetical protein